MPAADRVSTEVLPTHALTLPMWDEIWTLTSEFYDVEREYAEMELRRRSRIALFRMNGALLGMASIDTYPTTFRGRDIVVISTTHVLIRENWRGRNLVQRLGFRSFLLQIEHRGCRRLHPCGKIEVCNAGFELRYARMSLPMVGVERLQQL